MDTALWTQAIAIAEGDPGKTQAAYIRLRLIDLKKSAQTSPTNEIKIQAIEPKSAVGGLQQVRSDLNKKLQALGKSSLYSTLSLHPDASDGIVASAVADFESRAKVGLIATSAEFKYAKDTLGNPGLREQYDRRLLESLSNSGTSQFRSYSHEPRDVEYSWWESRKTSVIIGVLSIILFGYLALGFFKEKGGNEIQKASIDAQREVVHVIADVDQQKTQAAIDINNQNLDYRNRAAEQMQQQQILQQNRMQDMQDEQQRLQQERVNTMKAQQQQQAEALQAQKDQRYWACINQQLSVPRATSADAYARCGNLR